LVGKQINVKIAHNPVVEGLKEEGRLMEASGAPFGKLFAGV
jgi:hypothetical protein